MSTVSADRPFNSAYRDENLSRVAFPLGGIGAGMFCIDGMGSLSHMSIMNEPDVFNQPPMFAAVSLKGISDGARLLEGPVPSWRYFGMPNSGRGGGRVATSYGLPRFAGAEFSARFPFATVDLSDPGLPIRVTVGAFSPFIPGNADDSSLPVASLSYTFHNVTNRPQSAVFSYHALNFLPGPPDSDTQPGIRHVDTVQDGFLLRSRPPDTGLQSDIAITCDHAAAAVDARLFRGGWYDAATVVWKHICDGAVISNDPFPTDEAMPSPGGSIYVPFSLGANDELTISVRLAWYVPFSAVRAGHPTGSSCGSDCSCTQPSSEQRHRPWYSKRFRDIEEVVRYWHEQWPRLRDESARFRDCFYDSTLPAEVIEAIAANLTILKSPTCLRLPDGRFWAWEGCNDGEGCCYGSCTHVWNYAQALAHLFPDLERSMRDTEFRESQAESGRQIFRARLPIEAVPEEEMDLPAAADGQLGGIMKVYRDYMISADLTWLRSIWPAVRRSLDYCIDIWDPDRVGAVIEPHHNTYDIEFWGPDSMCTSFYCGALFAAARLARIVGDDVGEIYTGLYEKSRHYLENRLFDGEYFVQDIQWKELNASDPTQFQGWNVNYSDEARKLLETEGPKYQYGRGCLSDGILGMWIAEMAGLPELVDREKVRSHLLNVYRHNFKPDLTLHANPQRPTYALGHEAGLLLCTWPRGGQPTLPFVYSNEVWTGIEYQVASHLILLGEVAKGLEIVRAARRRYDGRIRNPFDEYECGHWYARALASYGLLQALTGIRYDAVEKTLYVKPVLDGDFRSFMSTATGYGTAGVSDGKAFLDVVSGTIDVESIILELPGQSAGESGPNDTRRAGGPGSP